MSCDRLPGRPPKAAQTSPARGRGLTTERRLLHTHRRAPGDEDSFYLAHDNESGAVYVIHEWLQPVNGRSVPGSARLELDMFLSDSGPAQDRMRELVGVLVKG